MASNDQGSTSSSSTSSSAAPAPSDSPGAIVRTTLHVVREVPDGQGGVTRVTENVDDNAGRVGVVVAVSDNGFPLVAWLPEASEHQLPITVLRA